MKTFSQPPDIQMRRMRFRQVKNMLKLGVLKLGYKKNLSIAHVSSISSLDLITQLVPAIQGTYLTQSFELALFIFLSWGPITSYYFISQLCRVFVFYLIPIFIQQQLCIFSIWMHFLFLKIHSAFQNLTKMQCLLQILEFLGKIR